MARTLEIIDQWPMSTSEISNEHLKRQKENWIILIISDTYTHAYIHTYYPLLIVKVWSPLHIHLTTRMMLCWIRRLFITQHIHVTRYKYESHTNTKVLLRRLCVCSAKPSEKGKTSCLLTCLDDYQIFLLVDWKAKISHVSSGCVWITSFLSTLQVERTFQSSQTIWVWNHKGKVF